MGMEVFCEIYSTQFSASDPVEMENVTDVEEILGMIEAIPVLDYMMVDLYLDVTDSGDSIFQETYSIQGCRSLEKLKNFVKDVWENCIDGRL